MPFLRILYDTIIESLFPLSDTERVLAELLPEQAFQEFPKAPPYAGLTVPLENTRSIFAYKDKRVSRLVWNIKYKRDKHSVAIGGYALWRELVGGGDVVVSEPMSPPAGGASAARPLRAPQASSTPTSPPPSFPTKTTLQFVPKVSPNPPVPAAKIMIIPIPTTARRRRERGYNQCELLADEIKRLDSEDRFTVEKNLLKRVQHSSVHKMKNRKERLGSARGIYEVDAEVADRLKFMPEFEKHKIVVIDDVITTGSTMKEALDTLKSAGFRNVAGLSLAH